MITAHISPRVLFSGYPSASFVSSAWAFLSRISYAIRDLEKETRYLILYKVIFRHEYHRPHTYNYMEECHKCDSESSSTKRNLEWHHFCKPHTLTHRSYQRDFHVRPSTTYLLYIIGRRELLLGNANFLGCRHSSSHQQYCVPIFGRRNGQEVSKRLWKKARALTTITGLLCIEVS
jgi:hypothetical protein